MLYRRFWSWPSVSLHLEAGENLWGLVGPRDSLFPSDFLCPRSSTSTYVVPYFSWDCPTCSLLWDVYFLLWAVCYYSWSRSRSFSYVCISKEDLLLSNMLYEMLDAVSTWQPRSLCDGAVLFSLPRCVFCLVSAFPVSFGSGGYLKALWHIQHTGDHEH